LFTGCLLISIDKTLFFNGKLSVNPFINFPFQISEGPH